MHESPTIRDPFPEHPFGGVIADRGSPDPTRTLPAMDIGRNYHGEILCWRCGEPFDALPYDVTFTRTKDVYRPCHKACAGRRKLTGWPGPRGDMIAIPKGTVPGEALRPNPVVQPGPDIVMVRNTPSLWSPGKSKYKLDR
jgi:hypothetical protein